MTYLFCFIWVPIFMYLAEKQIKGDKKLSGWIFILIAILIPSIIAGLRSTSQGFGSDVRAYVIPAVRDASYMDFNSFMKTSINYAGYIEPGYMILIYLCTRISSSPNFALFVLQFLTILFVALFAYKNRDRTNMTFVMSIYMLTWYCFALAIMRQSLSVAIILYSTTFFQDKEYFKTLLWFLLAISFHSSSFIALALYGLIFISQSKMLNKKKNIIYFLYCFVLIVCALFFQQIVYLFTYVIPILSEKIYNYTLFYFPPPDYNQLGDLFQHTFYLICGLVYMKFANSEKSKIDKKFIVLLLVTDYATTLLNYKVVNVYRMGFCFYYMALFYLIPNFKMVVKDDGKVRSFVSALCVVAMFGLWVFRFPIRNWCNEFPYKSDIIKFLR